MTRIPQGLGQRSPVAAALMDDEEVEALKTAEISYFNILPDTCGGKLKNRRSGLTGHSCGPRKHRSFLDVPRSQRDPVRQERVRARKNRATPGRNLGTERRPPTAHSAPCRVQIYCGNDCYDQVC